MQRYLADLNVNLLFIQETPFLRLFNQNGAGFKELNHACSRNNAFNKRFDLINFGVDKF